MKQGLAELIFILDKSGSMHSLTDDTIGGFNSLIEKQKQENGEAYVTTVLFDTNYDIIHDHINLQEMKELTTTEYVTGGCTALLDAIGITIDSVGKRLNNTPEEDRPEKVIIAITTDGQENASVEYTKAQIKDKIEHQQEKYNWTFIFLGANMDAVAEASSLGINANYASNWTTSAAGMSAHAEGLSAAFSTIRSADINTNTNAYDTFVASIKNIDLEKRGN